MNKYKAYYKLSNGEPRVANLFCDNLIVMDRARDYKEKLEKHHESPVRLIGVVAVNYEVIQAENGFEGDLSFDDVLYSDRVLKKLEGQNV
jgi:hypothetical protein